MELSSKLSFYHNIERFREDKPYEMHCHHKYEICYIIEGEITFKIEGASYVLTPGMGVIVKPLQYHATYSNHHNQKYERLIFEFDKSVVPLTIRTQFKNEINPIKIIYNVNVLNAYADLRNLDSHDDSFKDFYHSFFVQIAYLFTFSPQVDKKVNYLPTNTTVRIVLDYVNNNLKQSITLNDLCYLTHLSPTPLSTLFKKEMGISIKGYILQKKFAYAQKLILSGKSAKYTSLEVGYQNYNNFYLQYKKIIGHEPSKDLQLIKERN